MHGSLGPEHHLGNDRVISIVEPNDGDVAMVAWVMPCSVRDVSDKGEDEAAALWSTIFAETRSPLGEGDPVGPPGAHPSKETVVQLLITRRRT